MDNASKALIIAGAILIAVMLVSLGVMLYNTAANVAENSVGSIERVGVSGFNAQFEAYFGASKSREQVKGLIRNVNANNKTDNPTITLGGTAASEALIASDKVNQRYSVSGDYDSTGYLTSITINKI